MNLPSLEPTLRARLENCTNAFCEADFALTENLRISPLHVQKEREKVVVSTCCFFFESFCWGISNEHFQMRSVSSHQTVLNPLQKEFLGPY